MPQPSTEWSVNRMPGSGGMYSISVSETESPNTATLSGPCRLIVRGAAVGNRGVAAGNLGASLARTEKGGTLSPLAGGGTTATCGTGAGAVQAPMATTPATPPAAAGGTPRRRPPPPRAGPSINTNQAPAPRP